MILGRERPAARGVECFAGLRCAAMAVRVWPCLEAGIAISPLIRRRAAAHAETPANEPQYRFPSSSILTQRTYLFARVAGQERAARTHFPAHRALNSCAGP